jgi:hypothetical protein
MYRIKLFENILR